MANIVKTLPQRNITTLFHNVVATSSGVYKFPLSQRYFKTLLRPKPNVVTTLSQRYCASWDALPKYLKKELVRLEKRAIAIMNPGTHYNVASDVLNMRLIEDHHDLLCSRLFNSMMRDVNHKLAELLPPLYSSHHDLRNERKFNVPCTFTNRARNSFVFTMAAKV